MKTKNETYALITGGTSGIGYELAKQFARDGYNLILVARTEEKLQQAAENLSRQNKIKVVTIAKDLFDMDAPRQVYDEVSKQGLEVSALVNNAGQGEFGFFNETALQRDIDVMHLDMFAPVVLTKLFAKDMIARKDGKILFLASVVSKIPSPLLNVYSASKAFVYAFSIMLHNELKDYGITVTALLPGSTKTDFFHKAGMLNTKEYKEGKLDKAADVAEVGYKALMDGKDRVIAGAKNRMMVNMSAIRKDSSVVAQMRKKQKNIDGTEGKASASPSEGDKYKGRRSQQASGAGKEKQTGTGGKQQQ